MPDGDVAAQGVQHGFVEDLGDKAHVLVDHDPDAITDGYARRLLAAMLQGIEAKVGKFGDFLAGCPDAEHATGVPRLLPRIQLGRQPSVGLDHLFSLLTRAGRVAGVLRTESVR